MIHAANLGLERFCTKIGLANIFKVEKIISAIIFSRRAKNYDN